MMIRRHAKPTDDGRLRLREAALAVAVAMSAVALVALVALAGCAPPAERGGFRSDNPASLLHAIHHAGRDRDTTAVPQLVELLDHSDPAVRVMAIQALERITGHRKDYDPYAADEYRRPAVQRWVEHVRQGPMTAVAQP